ncbi:MAG: 3-deoxy-D-manno-octulosonic acid transferase [Bacteroidaceae bacterium]|nr:3-deoxy-D-manno-octulosonic acid transferase [Bacteroidaceae bacterium]
MYTLGIYLYIFFVKLAALFGHRKAVRMLAGHKEIYDKLKGGMREGVEYLWFHVSSLGEFEQARPLMEKIRAGHPEYGIVLTFFSPSGYDSAKNYQHADIICYLPFDTRLNAKRFVKMLNPKMAFFIKYEFWMNFLLVLRKRGVPTYSVSSIFRKKQVFFRPWGVFYRRALRCFEHLFVQNVRSKELLSTIGVENVTVTGDTRFDRVAKIQEAARQLPLVEAFVDGGKPVFVVGSSWGADEDVYLPYFNENGGWKLIIASHEVNEGRVKDITSRVKGVCVRYTQATMDEVRAADCLIVDCFGLLSSIYRYGDVAYVGGGFGVGIHNILEAAVYGMPVFFGPNNAKFQEAQQLKECGGGIEIDGAEPFAERMRLLSANSQSLKMTGEAAGNYVSANSGATQKILSKLNL